MNRPVRRQRLDLFSYIALTLLFFIALGCGASDEEPTPEPEPTCVEGESREAEDGCNTCTCMADGSWACTERACQTMCTPGETSFDGCNTCQCDEDGMWLCTKIYCEPTEAQLGESCSMNGTRCAEGLVCDYQCPDPMADPSNCNLGINPSGVCISAGLECLSDADCVTSGCSGQICQPASDPPTATTCEWRPEYACYNDPTTTSCGCNSGTCGWAQTAALQQCLTGSGQN